MNDRKAWECPVCHVGVAPHCDACPNCTKPLDLQGISIKIDPSLPPDEWHLKPSPETDYWTVPYTPFTRPLVTWIGYTDGDAEQTHITQVSWRFEQ
jgi:hypothetical protein